MRLRMELGERSYPIEIEAGALSRAGRLFDLDRRVLIVTDAGVPATYAAAAASSAGRPVVVTVPEGEGSKSFREFEHLLAVMLENGFTRKDCALAVGGGVVGDLTGFAASVYMRGIDFYNIPTTLLSQVDSSIGGKTAVDFHGYKNVVGSFWQPKGVLVDPDVLKTLPRRQLSAGLAEVVKMALTSDEELFRLTESMPAVTDAGLFDEIGTVIRRSLLIKKAVVEADEREADLRRILNFGHTLGHAIESAAADTSSPLLHGECVALGMLPMCSPAVRERLTPVLSGFGLPTEVSLPLSAVRDALTHDKKSVTGGIAAVFVDEPGTYCLENTGADELMKRYEEVFGGTK